MKSIVRIIILVTIATLFVMHDAFPQNDSLVVRVRDIDIVRLS